MENHEDSPAFKEIEAKYRALKALSREINGLNGALEVLGNEPSRGDFIEVIHLDVFSGDIDKMAETAIEKINTRIIEASVEINKLLEKE